MKPRYVITKDGEIYVQRDAENNWGFELLSDDQSFPGGVGLGPWTVITEKNVPTEDRERLGWMLEVEAAE